MSEDPAVRSLVARIAANTRVAGMTRVDREAMTMPARRGLLRKFEDQVDPDRKLPPDERARRAEAAKRAHFARLSLKAAEARRARRAA